MWICEESQISIRKSFASAVASRFPRSVCDSWPRCVLQTKCHWIGNKNCIWKVADTQKQWKSSSDMWNGNGRWNVFVARECTMINLPIGDIYLAMLIRAFLVRCPISPYGLTPDHHRTLATNNPQHSFTGKIWRSLYGSDGLLIANVSEVVQSSTQYLHSCRRTASHCTCLRAGTARAAAAGTPAAAAACLRDTDHIIIIIISL